MATTKYENGHHKNQKFLALNFVNPKHRSIFALQSAKELAKNVHSNTNYLPAIMVAISLKLDVKI
jgi:hypothetical protein